MRASVLDDIVGERIGANAADGQTKVELTPVDLPRVVDGREGDAEETRPFRAAFSEPKVLEAWAKVGAVPATHAAMLHPKVRHEAVDGDPAADQLRELQATHTSRLEKLARVGLNSKALTATLKAPKVAKVAKPTAAEAKIKALVALGSIKPSDFWHVCGTELINGDVLIPAQLQLISNAADSAATKKNEKIDEVCGLRDEADEILKPKIDSGAAWKFDEFSMPELKTLVKFSFAARGIKGYGSHIKNTEVAVGATIPN